MVMPARLSSMTPSSWSGLTRLQPRSPPSSFPPWVASTKASQNGRASFSADGPGRRETLLANQRPRVAARRHRDAGIFSDVWPGPSMLEQDSSDRATDFPKQKCGINECKLGRLLNENAV